MRATLHVSYKIYTNITEQLDSFTSLGLECICVSALLLRSWPAGFLTVLRGEPLWRLFMAPEPAGGPWFPPMESPELWPMYHLQRELSENATVKLFFNCSCLWIMLHVCEKVPVVTEILTLLPYSHVRAFFVCQVFDILASMTEFFVFGSV